MSGFTSFKFNYWDSVGTIQQLINDWQPAQCKTEKDYETSLYNFLRSSLPGIVVTPQYAFGRAKTDIAISDKLAIEIKKDLNDTSEFQRLIGQVVQFKDWKGYFLILLTGKTDNNLRDDLQKKIDDLNNSFGASIDPKITIIDKK
ncbi:MAG: hypothetical protein ABSA44_08120 [Bacteroidota bacterium]|jgi:hypothetical protein